MQVPSALVALLLVGLCTLGLVSVGVAQTPSADMRADLDAPSQPLLVYDIELSETGDATWTVSARFPVESPEQEAAFEEVAASFEEQPDPEYLTIQSYETVVAELGEEIGRSMDVGDVEHRVNKTETVGKLILEFHWSNFAEATNESLTVGDVFTSSDGAWFTMLDENHHLRIIPPANYSIHTSGMPVEAGIVWFEGPAELGADELRATFLDETDNGEDEQPPIDDDDSLIGPILGGIGITIAAVVLVLGIGYAKEWSPVLAAAGINQSRTTTEAPVTESEEPSESEPAPDPTLLSDDERVLNLINNNGGRMKQAAIVEATDWSNAKVSQLLSRMAEEERVEKLRLGRENLIVLPDELDMDSEQDDPIDR